MLTLRQHNESTRQLAEMLRNQHKAGVACDKCGTEMCFEGKPLGTGTGQHVHCPNCAHRGFKQESP